MTVALIAALVLGVMLTALLIAHSSASSRRTPLRLAERRRILFPFVAEALSADALDCALRLAAAEHATLVPTFLARVSLTLPLQAALPQQGTICLGLQETIEQRATSVGSPLTAVSNAAAPTDTPYAKPSPKNASTGSSSPPPTPTAPVSPPPTSAGSSTTPPARSSSSDPRPTHRSPLHALPVRQNPSEALHPLAKHATT